MLRVEFYLSQLKKAVQKVNKGVPETTPAQECTCDPGALTLPKWNCEQETHNDVIWLIKLYR